jgi:hypothetical protein
MHPSTGSATGCDLFRKHSVPSLGSTSPARFAANAYGSICGRYSSVSERRAARTARRGRERGDRRRTDDSARTLVMLESHVPVLGSLALMLRENGTT